MSKKAKSEKPLFDDMQSAVKRYRRAVKDFNAKVEQLTADLPENLNATRVTPNCQIVTTVSIARTKGLVLSPFTHDFRMQYKRISAIVKDGMKHPGKAQRKVSEILTRGTEGYGSDSYTYHPDAIENMRELLTDIMQVLEFMAAQPDLPYAAELAA